MLDPRLLEILVCPVTKGPLDYDRDAGELISRKAGLAYPIRDGIPIMLPDEARTLELLAGYDKIKNCSRPSVSGALQSMPPRCAQTTERLALH